MDLLLHRSVCLSQNLDARLEEPHRSGINRKMDSPNDDHGPSSPNNNFRRPSAFYSAVYFGWFFFQRTPFPAIFWPSFSMDGVPPISTTVSDFSVLFQNPSAISWHLLVPYSRGVLVQKTNLTSVSRVVDYPSYCLLDSKQMTMLQKARWNQDTKKRVEGFCPHLEIIRERNRLHNWPSQPLSKTRSTIVVYVKFMLF